ncbi:MAG: hypothetical protein ACJAYU_000531 [Bradymonadia bacterium]
MSETISALAISALVLAIALIAKSVIGSRIQLSPMPIRLRDVADPVSCEILALTYDPTLHPAVAREIQIGVLVATALRTAGKQETAALLLQETQSVAKARSPEAADELGRSARRHFTDL